MAAQHVLKHEKKMNEKKQKKSMIMEYNSAALKSSSPPPNQKSPSPKKSNYWTVNNHIYLNTYEERTRTEDNKKLDCFIQDQGFLNRWVDYGSAW